MSLDAFLKYRKTSEFIAAQSAAAEHLREVDEWIAKVTRECPPPDGMSYAMTAAGTLGLFGDRK